MRRLLVAGGGTGGHVLAGIAIADAWKKRAAQDGEDSEVLFVGSSRGIENRLVPQHGYSLKVLKVGALNRVGLWVRFKTMIQLPLSFLYSFWIVLTFRPDAVIGVGGYSSGPLVLLARILSIFTGAKTAVLEQNSIAGMTNRVLGKWVHQVFCAFETGTRNFSAEKTQVTGNPIRAHFKALPHSRQDPFVVFIFGGSQGAIGLNSMVLDALPFLKNKNIKIIHQTGIKDRERVQAGYDRVGIQARVETFIDDMEACYLEASLIICRAGASTLSELASVGRAAIFIPLPTAADNHQEVNARIFEAVGGAKVLPESSVSGKEFADLILELKSKPEVIQKMESVVKQFYRSDSAELVVEGLLEGARS